MYREFGTKVSRFRTAKLCVDVIKKINVCEIWHFFAERTAAKCDTLEIDFCAIDDNCLRMRRDFGQRTSVLLAPIKHCFV